MRNYKAAPVVFDAAGFFVLFLFISPASRNATKCNRMRCRTYKNQRFNDCRHWTKCDNIDRVNDRIPYLGQRDIRPSWLSVLGKVVVEFTICEAIVPIILQNLTLSTHIEDAQKCENVLSRIFQNFLITQLFKVFFKPGYLTQHCANWREMSFIPILGLNYQNATS